jgi:hypothetical protein
MPRTMSRGVLYLLHGTSLAARLTVSLWSLRQYYGGRIAVVSADAAAEIICRRIATESRLAIEHISLRLAPATPRNWGSIIKAQAGRLSPFETTVFLDCDTLVRGDMTSLFDLPADDYLGVTQFSTWTTDKPLIRRRIRSWSDTCPELIEPAVRFGHAINTGVFSFTRSTAVFERWFSLACAGATKFIPDEIALQLLIPHYPVVILDQRYNCSAKFGRPEDADTRIVHFHGRKHVGPYGKLWIEAYQEVVALNVAGICDWTPAGDLRLQSYLTRSSRSMV